MLLLFDDNGCLFNLNILEKAELNNVKTFIFTHSSSAVQSKAKEYGATALDLNSNLGDAFKLISKQASGFN